MFCLLASFNKHDGGLLQALGLTGGLTTPLQKLRVESNYQKRNETIPGLHGKSNDMGTHREGSPSVGVTPVLGRS